MQICMTPEDGLNKKKRKWQISSVVRGCFSFVCVTYIIEEYPTFSSQSRQIAQHNMAHKTCVFQKIHRWFVSDWEGWQRCVSPILTCTQFPFAATSDIYTQFATLFSRFQQLKHTNQHLKQSVGESKKQFNFLLDLKLASSVSHHPVETQLVLQWPDGNVSWTKCSLLNERKHHSKWMRCNFTQQLWENWVFRSPLSSCSQCC